VLVAVLALAPVLSLAQVSQTDRSDVASGAMPCHSLADPAKSDQTRHATGGCVCTPWCAFAAADLIVEPFDFERQPGPPRRSPDIYVRQLGIEPPLKPPQA